MLIFSAAIALNLAGLFGLAALIYQTYCGEFRRSEPNLINIRCL